MPPAPDPASESRSIHSKLCTIVRKTRSWRSSLNTDGGGGGGGGQWLQSSELDRDPETQSADIVSSRPLNSGEAALASRASLPTRLASGSVQAPGNGSPPPIGSLF